MDAEFQSLDSLANSARTRFPRDPSLSSRENMALVTERRLALSEQVCEICRLEHPGGIARAVILHEPDADVPWLLWVLPDGWSLAEHSEIAVCPAHQSNALIRKLRFLD